MDNKKFSRKEFLGMGMRYILLALVALFLGKSILKFLDRKFNSSSERLSSDDLNNSGMCPIKGTEMLSYDCITCNERKGCTFSNLKG